jgi:mono/diheme cytochrome c family protein
MRSLVLFSLLIAAALISACGVVVTPIWEAPPTEVAQLPTQEAIIFLEGARPTTPPTATPVPPSATPEPPTATPVLPTATPVQAAVEPTTPPEAAAPVTSNDPVAILASSYDPAEGEALFNLMTSTGYACSGCHLVNTEAQLIGPGLLNISTRGATRVAGMGAASYILDSILHPDNYVVEGFSDLLMPETYSTVFTEDQIYSIIAYLLTLNG